MNYPYSISPYIQSNMVQAMQPMMSGGPLLPNYVLAPVPVQQTQHIYSQLMMNYASHGAGGVAGGVPVLSQPSPYYGQLYQSQVGSYPTNPQSTALVPYTNYYAPSYNPNYNYPIVPYVDSSNRSKKKNRRGKNYQSRPHSNVYNSSSFDTNMENLSWSRLFGHHHHHRQDHHRQHRHHSKRRISNQGAITYERKGDALKAQYQQQVGNSRKLSILSDASSSSTSDESIRRVNVTTKPSTSISASQQQANSSLPFKYSSEFAPPPPGKHPLQKGTKKDTKVRSDDVFIIKKTQISQPSINK